MQKANLIVRLNPKPYPQHLSRYRIWWLHHLRESKTHTSLFTQKWMSMYDTKLDLGVKFKFSSSGELGIPYSLTLLPGPLWSRVFIVDRDRSKDQINLLENYSYSIGIFLNHIIVCKLFILKNGYSKLYKG